MTNENTFYLCESAPNLLKCSMGLNQKLNQQIDKEPEIGEEAANTANVTFDDLLVAVGASRNRDAFIRVFEHFAPRIKSFLMKSGIEQEMADELAQETMLTVWQRAESYDPTQSAASTWIFTIARNKRIDFLRKSGRPQPDINDPLMTAEPETMPDDALANLQEKSRLSDAIKQLPDEQSDLIRKSFFEEKTHADISKETGIPLGTVKSRIRLALEKLRYHMGGEAA